jgi:hypothetical protein
VVGSGDCQDLQGQSSHGGEVAGGVSGQMPRSGERAVTRGGTTYTMKTANIGPKTEPATKADGLSASEAKTPIVVVEPAKVEPAKPVPPPEAKPEPEPEPAKVVEFKSKWDFIYDRVKEIDRAIEAQPDRRALPRDPALGAGLHPLLGGAQSRNQASPSRLL